MGLPLEPTKEDLRAHPEVQAFMRQNIVLTCKDKVKKYEMPQEWLLLTEAFTVENEMLTPKMSIKRHAVVKAYLPALTAVYDQAAIASRARARAKEAAAATQQPYENALAA